MFRADPWDFLRFLNRARSTLFQIVLVPARCRMTRGPPLGDTGPGEPDHRTDGEGLKPCQPARSFYTMPRSYWADTPI